MARYRKVEVATWTDERFRELSAPRANAQTLWLYLLSGPRTTPFPGLVVASDRVIAADLGWTTEAFREAFREVSEKGLAKADWKAGLVVLRKALFDSTGEARETAKPQSPNVLKHWAKSWDEVPDCEMKFEYLSALGAFSESLGKAFREVFQEAFRKALLKASSHPSRIQDQDAETGSGSPPIAPQGGRFSLESPGLSELKTKVDAATGDLGKRRARGKPPVLTEQERAAVAVVLEKLRQASNVNYRGSDKHVRLIAARLREGCTELDLRAVIAFCAFGKGWKGDPRFEQYLRPETLFGPENIERYLDPARTWAEQQYPDEFKPSKPDPSLVEPAWMAGGSQ